MKTTSSLILFVFCSLLTTLVTAADVYQAPRTEWGKPDLQGVWNFSSNVPMQRPTRYGERQFLTDQEIEELLARRAEADANSDSALPIPGVDESYNDFWIENAGIGDTLRTSHIIYPTDGRLPDLAEGAVTRRRNTGSTTINGPEDRGLSERCLVGFNAGPPFVPSLYNNNVQIFQNQDHVVLMTEMIHDARIVPVFDSSDARPMLDENLRLWSGDSRGHWDGDTLVVVTNNFSGQTRSFGGSGTSLGKVLTERLTRVGPYTVDYEFTIDDPVTYSDKITAIVSMTRVAGLLYEYACHEGNYGMVNILRGARVQEALAEEAQ
ncbi:MAG: hypothetical protein QGG02_01450 [Gammaproteobacteria bacterium]|jgi:hypothetical protein|nr:hypothetical protein [Gammaproteobacteria bacterium]MDP6734204.1 hypothetical protein [Gammaproteobacteria bacterium]